MSADAADREWVTAHQWAPSNKAEAVVGEWLRVVRA